jgi:hypothetical protein
MIVRMAKDKYIEIHDKDFNKNDLEELNSFLNINLTNSSLIDVSVYMDYLTDF